jgi:acetyl esterase/lipase
VTVENCSEAFLDALQQRGAKVDLFLYEGKTHTDLFLQVITASYCTGAI